MSSDIPYCADNKPRHIAIIMDGNNRWAKQKRLLGVSGHKAGVEAVRAVVKTCREQGIEVLTLFAFSSENWRRPADEVSALMRLFLLALQREINKLDKNNICLKIIGDRSKFSPLLQDYMEKAERQTASNTGMTLVIAANYGGQWDITQAAQKLALKVAQGSMVAEEITEQTLQDELCMASFPMPDLMIRTAGEKRISNFMLWQLAYAEFYFSDLYWPDFREDQIIEAIEEYANRERRFGQTNEQLSGEKSDAVSAEDSGNVNWPSESGKGVEVDDV